MGEEAPVVYIFHGDDEYAIAGQAADMISKLGDPGIAEMNTTRLDGNSCTIEQVILAASAMPFLARRRLVILTHPLARLKEATAQKKFTQAIEKLPPSTALVLIEQRLLTSVGERKKNKIHWLEKWAVQHKGYALLKPFLLPKGPEMVSLLQEMAQKEDGQITPEAANLLAALVDGDPRLAHQEIQKLLAYVNYRRPIEIDDVQAVTADADQGDIFTLVDALGYRDGHKAMEMLQRLLEYQEYYAIFGMVVRQFRHLLLTREVLDHGGQRGDVARQLRVPAFTVDRLLVQARRFQMPDLQEIYHRLLEVDEAVKTSQMPDDLALETFVAALTS